MGVTVLAGGVGAAKFLRGMVAAIDAGEVTVIGNTGDDTVVYGLHVSPDLDIVTYTLAGIVDPRGWGVAGDSLNALDQLARYGFDTWFTLGDRDIGTHMARTQWLAEGLPLSEVADRLRRALGVGCRIIPMSDDRICTRVVTAGGQVREFQEYFVKLRHAEPVAEVRFDGAPAASPAPGVLEAIEKADRLVVCPSNPILSIGPILAVPGIRDALAARKRDVYAISPLIAGAALKGPAAALMAVAGAEANATGVASLYQDFCETLLIDTADAELAGGIAELGVRPVATGIVMNTAEHAHRLAAEVLAL